jgi:hypothetical protein
VTDRPELCQGDRGPWVERLQHLLTAERFPCIADGDFGPKTAYQVRAFQAFENLAVDGVVGELTWAALEQAQKARGEGDAEVWAWAPQARPDPPSAPERPDFDPIRGNVGRHEVFGYFKYTHSPTPDNPESIKFLDDWPKQNIVTIEIPQLMEIPGIEHDGRRVGQGPRLGTVSVHRYVASQMLELWEAWEDNGLLDRIITWGGLWAPRFIRGSKSVLSNHAFGSAFDLNVPWNGLGREPARAGQKGCVWDLVALAHEYGFYWGGHFQRRDGMHFEVATIL